MTQAEAESVARAMRARCMHSSWRDLVSFWKGVMDSLDIAYRQAVQDDSVQQGVKKELAEVLEKLQAKST